MGGQARLGDAEIVMHELTVKKKRGGDGVTAERERESRPIKGIRGDKKDGIYGQ